MDLNMLVSPVSGADWTIAIICVISGLIGLRGGFIKEAISLFGWILAHFIATVSAEPITIAFGIEVDENSLLYLFSYGLVFAAVVVFFSTVGAGMSARVQSGQIKLGNSLLGGAFGVARGVVIISVSSLLLGAASSDLQEQIFGDSVYEGHLNIVENWLVSGFESDLFRDPNSLLDDTVDQAADIREES